MALTVTARGSAANNTAGTTYTFSPSGNLATYSVLCVMVSADNSASAGSSNNITSVSDSHGNTYAVDVAGVYDNGAASAGVQGSIWTGLQDKAPITTSTVITVTFGASTTAKSYALWEVHTSDVTKQPAPSSGTAQAGATTASPSVTTGSITVGNALIAFIAGEAGTTQTHTADADATNGTWSTAQYSEVGSTTSGNIIASQYKVQTTSNSTQTYNPTFGLSQDSQAFHVYYFENGNVKTVTLGLLDSGPTLYAPNISHVITLPLLDAGPALYAPTVAGVEVVTYVNSASVVATGSQTSLVVPVPSGVANGDILVMAVYLTASTGVITSPAGWNVLYANDVAGSSTSSHSSLFWRTASSEPASYTITTTSGRSAGAMFVARGATGIEASSSAPNTTADLSVIASALSPSQRTMILGVFGGRLLPNGSGWTASQPSGMTEVVDASSVVAATSNSGIAMDYEYVNSGSTGTRTSTITTATTVDWIAYLVSFSYGSGPQTLTLGLLDGANALYAPTFTLAPYPITLGLLDGSNALYAPTITPQWLMSLGLLDAANALYAPTLVVGPATLTLGLLDAGAALYAPTILPGPVGITLGLLDGSNALYAPTLTPENLLSLGLLDASNALYAPTFGFTIFMPLLDAGPALYAPTIVSLGGLQSLTLGLLDGSNALYAPTLTPKNLLTLGLLDAANALYAPTLAAKYLVSLGLLDAANALYAPTLTPKNLLTLGLLDAANALYAPTLVGLAVGLNVFLPLLDSGRALYPVVISFDTDSLQMELVALEIWGMRSVSTRVVPLKKHT